MAEARRTVAEIDVDELAALMEPGNDAPDLLLIDIREADEHARGFVPGCVAIPRGILESTIEKRAFAGKVAESDLGRPIVLYCAGGNRSALAAVALRQMGFTNVQSLAGGFGAWGKAGRPVAHPRSAS